MFKNQKISQIELTKEEKGALAMMQRQRNNPYALKLYKLYVGGLIAFILVVLQAFLGVEKPDIWITISVSAFAVALPPLAGVLIVNQIAEDYMYRTGHPMRKRMMNWLTFVGVLAALIGMVAAFCHIFGLAGGLFAGMLFVTMMFVLWHVAEFER